MKQLLIIISVLSVVFMGFEYRALSSAKTGFFIPLPENWFDQTQLSVKDNLSNFDLSEEEIDKLLQSHKGSIPVVIYMKYDPQEFVGPIPTIQVNLRPNRSSSFGQFKEIMKTSMGQMASYFENYKLLRPLEEINVDGVKGITFLAQFDLPNEKGDPWTIRSWTYAFPNGKYFYQINFSDTENEKSEDVYHQVIQHVKFKK